MKLLELGKDLRAEEVQRPHDLVVGGVSGLNHDQELVNPQVRPPFHATADRVDVASDDEAVLDQVFVGPLEDSLADSGPGYG